MQKFLHTISVPEQAVATDSVVQFDLAVNPLSVVLLNLKPCNDNAGTAVDGRASYLDVCASLNRASIFHRGRTIVSARGEDLAVLNYYRRGVLPMEANGLDTDNDKRSVVLPIFLGRFPFDGDSCFPATRRGELVLELDIDVADTGYDTFRLSVETIELLDAKPKEFERITAVNRTFAATGQQDFILTNGQLLRGLLMFGTTAYSGAAPAPTWGRTELRLENEQHGFASSDFETLHMMNALLGRQPPVYDTHTHRVDATAASAIQKSGRPIEQSRNGVQNYAWMDLDPTRDDAFSVETAKSTFLALRTQCGTADAARVLMIERIGVGEFDVGT